MILKTADLEISDNNFKITKVVLRDEYVYLYCRHAKPGRCEHDQALPSVLESLSDLFFIKDWKAIVLERLQEGIKAPVSLLPVSIPPELVEDIGLASHLIRFLPQKACVLVKNGKIVYASSTGDLPEIEGGVFVLKGVFKGHGKYTTHLLTDEVFIIPKEKIVPNKSGKGYATDALGFWARVTGDEKEIEATLNGPFRYAKVSLVVRNGKIVYKFVGPEE